METQVRPAPDTPSTATAADWANSNRSTLIKIIIAAVAVLIVVVAATLIYNARSASAQDAFGAAMRTYDMPVAGEGPVPPGTKTFPSATERARQANSAFATIADKYGMTTAGKNAKYMAGVTAVEMGQTATGEKLLKEVGDGSNADRASLANLALANLYHQLGRDNDAITVYNKLTEKPTIAVPAGLAQLQLASLYESQNKQAEAKKIYAQLKDKDAKSAVGEMAARKLSGDTATR